MTCTWCKKIIDPHRQAHVWNTVPLPNGGRFTYRFHATGCYLSFKWFMEAHAQFGPLAESAIRTADAYAQKEAEHE